MASGLESSPFAKYWIRNFLKPRAQLKKPKVPKHKSMRPTEMKRSISAPLLPTIDEEAGEGPDEADIEDNEHVSPDSSSSNETKHVVVDSKLKVPANPTAHDSSQLQPPSSSRDVRQEMKLISKRVSDLEGSLAFAQEQIQERDERLFECQQNITESIAKGIADGLDTQRSAWEAQHMFRLRSKNEEVRELQLSARLESDVQGRDSLIQKLSEPHTPVSITQAEKKTFSKADMIQDGPNSFLRLL